MIVPKPISFIPYIVYPKEIKISKFLNFPKFHKISKMMKHFSKCKKNCKLKKLKISKIS